MNPHAIFVLILNLLVIGGFSYFIYLRLNNSPARKLYFPALFFKVACGLALGLLYFYYYQKGDTVFYFNAAKDLLKFPIADYLQEVFFTKIPYNQRSTLPMVKITSLFLWVTGSNYWLATIYFSLFSFCGCFYFVHQLAKKYPEFKMTAAISFLFYPSVMFWSSGILKESVVFGIVMFLSGFLIRYYFWRKINIWQVFIFMTGGWLMLVLKYYIAAVFLPVVVVVFLLSFANNSDKIKNSKPVYKYFGLVLLVAGVVIWASNMQYNLDITRIFSVVKDNQQQILATGNPENMIHFLDESQSILMVFPNLIIALFSGLFGPVFPQMTSFLQVTLCIENLMVLVLFFTSLNRKIKVSDDNRVLIYGGVIYILILATLLSYATPDFGTLTRYKVYFMPYFLMFILCKNLLVSKLKSLIKFL
ncbi:hypothetical protein [Reichenbachiella sp. MALMAid0571]|uniref:hypothetical protein n=1 Tax=Reichenbachiella sp. MALMAid0571 TaxID=3143939 RepID=UPI0032DFAAA6